MSETSESAPKETGILQFLSVGLKYSVMLGFGLYALGFVIWYAFLGRYGLYPRSIQSFEFFAAALCYLGFVGALAGPPILLYFLTARTSPENVGSSIPTLEAILAVWYAILFTSKGFYFPSSKADWSSWVPLGALLAVFVFGRWRRLSERPPLVIRILGHNLTRWTISTVAMLLWIVRSAGDSSNFLLMTIFLLGLALGGAVIGGPQLDELWKRGVLEVRVLICFFVALIVITHARGFGAMQFAKISREFGGGQSEVAMIKLTRSLDFTTNSPPQWKSNTLLGPVVILSRTEKEVIIIPRESFLSPANAVPVFLQPESIETITFLPSKRSVDGVSWLFN